MTGGQNTTPPASGGGCAPSGGAAQPCPYCEYWNQNHFIDYNGPDRKFVPSTQISAMDVAFRLEANLASGNITVTSIFKWGTVAADVTSKKADTIAKFKAMVTTWSDKFNMKIVDPICGTKTLPIKFRLLWSPDDTTDAAPYTVNLVKTRPRGGVSGWDVNIGYDSQVVSESAWVLRHEYGHTLCLQDEYFYTGVTAASVEYKKADGTSETITLEPAANIMSKHGDTTYLKRFFYFTAIEAQELLRSKSGRDVTCEVV